MNTVRDGAGVSTLELDGNAATAPGGTARTLDEELARVRGELAALRHRHVEQSVVHEAQLAAAWRRSRLDVATAALAAACTVAEVARAVCREGREALGADGAALAMAARPGHIMIVDELGLGVGDVGVAFGADDPLPAAEAYRRAAPVWLEDAESIRARYPREDGRLDGHEAWLALPLVVDGAVAGVMEFAFAAARCFDPDDRALAATLAERCAHALHRARSYDEALREIAERTNVEAALRRSEATLRGILDATRESIWLFDENRALLANETGLARFDKPPSEIIGKLIEEIVPPAVARVRRERVRQVFATGRPVEFEDERDGLSFHHCFYPIFDEAGRVTTIACYSRDITAWKLSEAAFRQRTLEVEEAHAQTASQARLLEAVMDALPVGVSILDADGAVIRKNRAFDEVWGGALPPVHSIEDHARYRARWADSGERLDPEDWAAAQVVRTGQAVLGQILEIERFDGQRRFVINGGAPIRDAAGVVVGCAVAIQDITEMRAAQEALREADRRKNEFIAVLSHELRNPLAPIRNSLYILEHVAPGGERARHAQAVIERQTDQLNRLVDDLLDVTRISQGKIRLQPERLDLVSLVRATAEDYREMIERSGVALVLVLPDEPVVTDGDRARLAQVLGNLLHNAAKFTPEGGRIELALRGDRAATKAILEVGDTGVGLEAEMLDRVFEPFTQADRSLERSRGGLGLGLALARGLVELHGGVIAAASPGPGQGARFTVQLPLAAAEVAVATAAPVAPPPVQPLRVLLIEDNQDAADTLREALELSGLQVQVAGSGAAALDRARREPPDVVLCDIGLPGMSGYEVARAFRGDSALASVHLVALTGYAGPDEQRLAAEAGFERHLAKPVNLVALGAVLTALGGARER